MSADHVELLIRRFARRVYSLRHRPRLPELLERIKAALVEKEVLWVLKSASRRVRRPGRPRKKGLADFTAEVDRLPGSTARARLRRWANGKRLSARETEDFVAVMEKPYSRYRKRPDKTQPKPR